MWSSLKFSKEDATNFFLKERNRDYKWLHGLLSPLAKLVVEVKREVQGLSTLLENLLHVKKVKPKAKGKSVWNEISWKNVHGEDACFLYTSVCVFALGCKLL